MDKIIRMVREVKDTTIAVGAVNSDKFLTRTIHKKNEKINCRCVGINDVCRGSFQ
ncbi:MAG: hypothetical protein Ta2C_03010 [Candidatus Endomicrobiellum trichonymphae]|uniref:hypothetical protein n=1 Tax=Endomicrobium trichonymphae TaxID=1408204 RepID=UPI000322BF2F|nr:MAG: hypothetical protein Ta2C_03010 [Candidatus Endomicrobium trichonymphae]